MSRPPNRQAPPAICLPLPNRETALEDRADDRSRGRTPPSDDSNRLIPPGRRHAPHAQSAAPRSQPAEKRRAQPRGEKCGLGFDWHSSGVTTVTCGALKEAYKHFGADLGIVVAGGKGATSRRAPDEIAAAADRLAISAGERLVYASRMSAKVDSAAVQDGFQLYHHVFLFTPTGQWSVIQQGMNADAKTARRYHWLGETVDDFVCEPHGAISDITAPSERTRPSRPPIDAVKHGGGRGRR